MVNNNVLSVNYDSSSSEENSDFSSSEDDFSQEIEDEDVDDKIEEISIQLKDFLNEVADVEIINNESIFVKFFDKKIVFSDDDDCEFDEDDEGYPIMINGGEVYFKAYLNKLGELNDDYKGILYRTNVGKEDFYLE